MKNLLVLASQYGVQLKADDLLAYAGAKELTEEQFKKAFQIPITLKTFRKNKNYNFEDMLALAAEREMPSDVMQAILNNEIAYLKLMESNSRGYGKKARADEFKEKAQVLWERVLAYDEQKPAAPASETSKPKTQKEVITAENLTVELLEKSGMNRNSRRFLILLAQIQTKEQVLQTRPDLEKGEIYIPTKEYFELVTQAKEYFAPQLEAALKTLNNKF